MVDAIAHGAIGGGARVAFEDDMPWLAAHLIRLFERVYFLTGHAAGCLIFAQRADFEAVGGFSEAHYAAEEYAFSRAMRRRGRFVILRARVLTSSRKFRMYSTTYLISQGSRILWRFMTGAVRRDGLNSWYDARREK